MQVFRLPPGTVAISAEFRALAPLIEEVVSVGPCCGDSCLTKDCFWSLSVCHSNVFEGVPVVRRILV